MNTALLTQGLSIANAVRAKLAEDNNARKRDEYDELREASQRIQDLRERVNTLADGEAKDNVRRGLLSAGPVTQSSHVRIAQARKDLEGSFGDWAKRASEFGEEASDQAQKATKKARKALKPWGKKAKKTSARVQKRAEEAAQKAADRMTGKVAKREKRKKALARAGSGVGIAALIAAIGTALWYFLLRRDNRDNRDNKAPVATLPPRVEEHAAEEPSTLVYTTTSEGAEDDPDEFIGTSIEIDEDLVPDSPEEPAERDEELLDSIDEQLRQSREEKPE